MKDPVAVVINVEEDANGEKVTYSATYGGENATMTNGEVNLTAATQSSGKQPVATGAIENKWYRYKNFLHSWCNSGCCRSSAADR